MKILLLEDDPILSQTMIDFLEDEGYSVDWVSDGEAALDASYEQRYDLYLFDVNVPLLNGFELLKALREAEDTTPTFFITALVDINSLGLGFEVGADDYIKKPFDPDELIIRIKAKMKPKDEGVKHGDVVYDPSSGVVRKAEKIIDLGQIQHEIFRLLITHQGQTVDKMHFLEVMEQPTESALRVHITKLKKLLDLDISNIRGIGYRLEKR
ncbi:MAG: response regulator transcription factor [Thiovulaceae bacterium]|nr:response regulator transcription factor [Sulfurimonadaceae bacterium]